MIGHKTVRAIRALRSETLELFKSALQMHPRRISANLGVNAPSADGACAAAAEIGAALVHLALGEFIAEPPSLRTAELPTLLGELLGIGPLNAENLPSAEAARPLSMALRASLEPLGEFGPKSSEIAGSAGSAATAAAAAAAAAATSTASAAAAALAAAGLALLRSIAARRPDVLTAVTADLDREIAAGLGAALRYPDVSLQRQAATTTDQTRRTRAHCNPHTENATPPRKNNRQLRSVPLGTTTTTGDRRVARARSRLRATARRCGRRAARNAPRDRRAPIRLRCARTHHDFFS